MLFLLKKIIAPFLLPFTIFFILIVISMSKSIRKQGIIKSFLLIAACLIFILSSYRCFDPLIRLYEKQHPSLIGRKIDELDNITYIVVLGGGVSPRNDQPFSSNLSTHTLVRLVEGLQLSLKFPDSKIILSGGKVFCDISEASVMRDFAISLGFSKDKFILEEKSRDTKDQAINIKNIVAGSKFILVTSAYHMPRSVLLFKKQELTPIPAPTAHLVTHKKGFQPGDLYPSVESFRRTQKFFREIIGITWAFIVGQI